MTLAARPDAAVPSPATAPVLEVAGLRVTFATDDGPVVAVEDVSFTVDRGRTLCVVGESGSGKTVSALAALGLLDPRTTRVEATALRLQGRDLLTLPPRELRALRGDRMAVIFQDPMTALNPYLRIGEQLTEVLRQHRRITRADAELQAVAALQQVGIPAAAQRLKAYPHELSGGMRQRVVIAMALLCKPDLVFADEPTTALDVTIQAQVLQLMQEQQRVTGMALVLVTHDMGVVAHMADEVIVMYAGLVMERGPVQAVFHAPRHPYTVGLLGSLPGVRGGRGERLYAIPGLPPLPTERPPACVFAPRCALAVDQCRQERPAELPVPETPGHTETTGHTARCWRAAEVPAWALAIGVGVRRAEAGHG